MVYRKKPDTLPDSRRVLDLMGRCRKGLIEESDRIQPFCEQWRAMHRTIEALDTLATELTGSTSFYAIGGSTGLNGGRWVDSGTKP